MCHNRISMKKYDYMELSEWLEEQMHEKESFDVEFKSAAGGFPASFWETYSSFANTDGGTIVLGVKEKDDDFFLDNLTEKQVAQYEKIFWSDVNNRNKINHNLLTNNDVKHVMLDGHHILLFYIPRASREMRPIHCTLNPDNGTYKRNYEGDFKCTPLEVRRMFADSNVNTPADSRILEGYSFDDIDKTSLQQFRRLFDAAKPGHAWLALDDLSLLKKLGGYRIDRKSGKEGFTLAGILMFGKNESITDDECAPFFFPDYRELPEIPNFRERWIDRIYADGTWCIHTTSQRCSEICVEMDCLTRTEKAGEHTILFQMLILRPQRITLRPQRIILRPRKITLRPLCRLYYRKDVKKKIYKKQLLNLHQIGLC